MAECASGEREDENESPHLAQGNDGDGMRARLRVIVRAAVVGNMRGVPGTGCTSPGAPSRRVRPCRSSKCASAALSPSTACRADLSGRRTYCRRRSRSGLCGSPGRGRTRQSHRWRGGWVCGVWGVKELERGGVAGGTWGRGVGGERVEGCSGGGEWGWRGWWG